jgi:phosphatidate cytidylyltransferase
MIDAILLFTATSFLLGAAGVHGVNLRSSPEKCRERWIKLGVYFLVVHAVLLCALLGRGALGALFLLVAVVGACELVRALHASAEGTSPPSLLAILTSYAALAAGLVAFALSSAPSVTLYVYLVVAAFDGFSQIAGETFGRRQLAPHVSPNKTVEGALGGLLGAVSTGLALRSLPQISWLAAAVASVVTGAGALGGDLAASWVKRRSGIKDFGGLLPGQGGVLDRFDSLLLAGATAQLFSKAILQ